MIEKPSRPSANFADGLFTFETESTGSNRLSFAWKTQHPSAAYSAVQVETTANPPQYPCSCKTVPTA
ncbi:hypothetical protein [Neisseria animalis]|uniref:hypothetical protein n=1 Tax=Neisseria animalis TaxID=492 RepID=UPI000F4ECDCE|nr:hypothetical protein [Neisseria animalis]